jgi:hypothetical protein
MALGLALAAGCIGLAVCLVLPEWSLGDVAGQACALSQEHPWLYWIPGYAALAALVVLAALPLLVPGLAGRPAWWASRSAFVVLTAATVVLFRWPGLAAPELNPDESENIALALALQEDPRYWVSAEGGTHGPLVEFALLPVRLAGMRLEYGSARLVGLGLWLGCLFFQFGTLRCFFPEPISRVVLTPVTVGLAFQTFFDYVAYNAEQPAIFLLCAGAYGCARLAAGPRGGLGGRALATGFALGLVPFAKLQGVPAGLVLAAVALGCVLLRYRGQGQQQWTTVLALVAGGLAPLLLVLVYLGWQGRLSHFWTSYIEANLDYTRDTGRDTSAKVDYFLQWAPEWLTKLFLPYFLITALALITAAAGLAVMAVLCRKRLGHLDSPSRRLLLLFVGGVVLGVSLYSVVLSGRPFQHYLLFLWFPVTFLAAAVLATLHEAGLGRWGRFAMVAVCLASAVAVPSVWAFRHGNPWLAAGPAPSDPVADLIRRYASPGERLVVWGWMDRYYVLTGMPPGTMHPDTSYILDTADKARRDYFFAEYLRQFDQARPPVFVDAVGEDAFHFTDRGKDGHENFTDLHRRITAGYVLVGEINESRVYVAKERLAERPVTEEIPVAVEPVDRHRIEWHQNIAKGEGSGSYLVFALPKALWVKAVRITLDFKTAGSPATFTMYGKRKVQVGSGTPQNVTAQVQVRPGRKTLTLPVKSTIDEIRIHPDTKPFECNIEAINLLTPEVPETAEERYRQQVRQIQEKVRTALPKDARVLVLSKGDEELLKLGDQRTGWHFPQNPDGTELGYIPEDSSTPIAQLKRLRGRGGQFLLIPEPHRWWLDAYPKFKRCLGKPLVNDPKTCVIFDLRQPH